MLHFYYFNNARSDAYLTTDFGLSDHYVGVMKGVILSICPRGAIVDISHGVGVVRDRRGRIHHRAGVPSFPRGTVNVVVVDPGVGTERRPILTEAAGEEIPLRPITECSP